MADPNEGGGSIAFDFAYFDTYTSGDEALQREVLQLFFGQIDSLVAALDPDGSNEDWRAGAHAIKGGSQGVGFVVVGELCQHMERMKDEDAATRRSAIADLTEALRNAKESVAAQYAGIFDT